MLYMYTFFCASLMGFISSPGFLFISLNWARWFHSLIRVHFNDMLYDWVQNQHPPSFACKVQAFVLYFCLKPF